MREIKFRAWNKKREAMAFVSAMFLNNLEYHEAVEIHYPFNHKIEKTQEIVNLSEVELMQYTGLKDCKGREIYEGDIIKIDDYIGGDDETDSVNLLEVRFVFGKFIADLPGQFGNLDLTEINKTCEVVGNIYQNPEFLGE